MLKLRVPSRIDNVPKAGILAESAALVVADDIAAEITGEDPPAPFEASGVCYAEFGDGLVSKVEVTRGVWRRTRPFRRHILGKGRAALPPAIRSEESRWFGP